MNVSSEAQGELELDTVKQVFERACEDLAMLLDRPLTVEAFEFARSPTKVAGERQIHIAFRLALTIDGKVQHGALLVPLPDAIACACYLMTMADDVVTSRRKDRELDRATKDAMVEVGNLFGGSTDAVLRERFGKRVSVRAEGCQGLKAGVAPGFERTHDADLLVGRAKLKLHTFPVFEAILMLPLVPAAPQES